jgi:hypothetical protein
MRMPLPQFSATLPSAFHTVMRGEPSSQDTSRTPSAPTPKWGSQMARAAAALMGPGSASRSTTTWWLPVPCHFSKRTRTD